MLSDLASEGLRPAWCGRAGSSSKCLDGPCTLESACVLLCLPATALPEGQELFMRSERGPMTQSLTWHCVPWFQGCSWPAQSACGPDRQFLCRGTSAYMLSCGCDIACSSSVPPVVPWLPLWPLWWPPCVPVPVPAVPGRQADWLQDAEHAREHEQTQLVRNHKHSPVVSLVPRPVPACMQSSQSAA